MRKVKNRFTFIVLLGSFTVSNVPDAMCVCVGPQRSTYSNNLTPRSVNVNRRQRCGSYPVFNMLHPSSAASSSPTSSLRSSLTSSSHKAHNKAGAPDRFETKPLVDYWLARGLGLKCASEVAGPASRPFPQLARRHTHGEIIMLIWKCLVWWTFFVVLRASLSLGRTNERVLSRMPFVPSSTTHLTSKRERDRGKKGTRNTRGTTA